MNVACTQIVIDDVATLIINLAMTLIALASAIYACLAYRHQRNRSKKEAACKLAAHYTDVVLKENSFISGVYKQAGIDNFISQTIDINEIKNFDKTELDGLLKQKQVQSEDLMRRLYDVDAFTIFNCRLLRASSLSERENINCAFLVNDEKTGAQRVQNEAQLKIDFKQDIIDLLNQLEWFAMNCHYGLADEELLYQSLHKTFLSLVWMLYPIISINNTNNEDKMYTNITWLFLKWRDRLGRIKGKAQRAKEASEKKARRAQEKADRAHADAEAPKAKVFNGKRLK